MCDTDMVMWTRKTSADACSLPSSQARTGQIQVRSRAKKAGEFWNSPDPSGQRRRLATRVLSFESVFEIGATPAQQRR
jgi:hypothetical protein